MYIIGVGTAAPGTRYTQAQCHEALLGAPQFAALSRRSRVLLERLLLGDNGIRTRALALAPLSDAFDARPDVLHRRFVQNAPLLAEAAARKALERAGCAVEAIDGLVVSTCTGYLCPGLSSYIVERLGLRADAIALDLVGQGCGAALPNLRTADAYIDAGRCETMLSISVEVCSAAFYIDDDVGVLVSACLFGDGAGAAVVSRTPRPRRLCPRWIDSRSITVPAHRDALRFEQRDGMLRNILTPEVPKLAAEHAAQVLDAVLAKRELERADIKAWLWHAGGRTVLEALQRELDFPPGALTRSANVLRDYGNVSSACVYFVLESALEERAEPGWWWMSSFGAGFSCHGALLEARAA